MAELQVLSPERFICGKTHCAFAADQRRFPEDLRTYSFYWLFLPPSGRWWLPRRL